MAKTKSPKKPTKKIQQSKSNNAQKLDKPPPSWASVRSLLTCKHLQTQPQQPPPPPPQPQPKNRPQKQKPEQPTEESSSSNRSKKSKTVKCSGSLCNNTKVMHRPELLSPEENKKGALINSESDGNSHRSTKGRSLSGISNGVGVASSSSNSSGSSSSFTVSSGRNTNNSSSNSSSNVGGFRGMPFRRFSGCYECRMVVDPVLGFTRDLSFRPPVYPCPHCGEIFMKAEDLDIHQTVRHAVSELGPEDTSKNIVEIIFQSSWLRKQSPICKIDRILKVQNTPKTISKFEEYRDSIKAKATKHHPKKHPRCIADGNELLRFHSTTFACSLGINGSSNLCNSIPTCSVCSIIKNGFRVAREVAGDGILTTATSGRAHDSAGEAVAGEKRAMLVCRVIAGRVKKSSERAAALEEEFDSVAGEVGMYSNLDELYVINPRAILPCFVVIYSGF